MAEAEAPAEGRWASKAHYRTLSHRTRMHCICMHCTRALVRCSTPATEEEAERFRASESERLRGAKLLSMRVLVDKGAGSRSLLPACAHVGFCVQTLHAHGA